MSFSTSIIYTLDGTGTEIPAIPTISNYQEIYIIGSATSIGNYAIVPTGTPIQGLVILFKYSGTLDITTNSNTFAIFGQSLTQNFLSSKFEAECTYNGTAWVVVIKPNLANFSIGSSTLGANAVATVNIQDGAVTTNKIANLAITASKIANNTITETQMAANSIGTPELIAGSVDSTILSTNAVGTSNITNAVVTNAKLASPPTHSIKIGDGSSLVQDLQLPANQVPMSNGTTIVGIDRNALVTSVVNAQLQPGGANTVKISDGSNIVQDLSIGVNQVVGRLSGNLQGVNRSSLLTGTYETIDIAVSFETGEQTNYSFFIPFDCTCVNILYTVIKVISGTDDGTITFDFPGGVTNINVQTIPMSSALSSGFTSGNLGFLPGAIGQSYSLTTSKPTVGGKVLVSFLLQRT